MIDELHIIEDVFSQLWQCSMNGIVLSEHLYCNCPVIRLSDGNTGKLRSQGTWLEPRMRLHITDLWMRCVGCVIYLHFILQLNLQNSNLLMTVYDYILLFSGITT